MEGRERSPYALVSEAAARPGLQFATAEVATLASDHDMGGAELGALAVTFDCLAEKGRRASTGTLPEPSGLPTRGPKPSMGSTFRGYRVAGDTGDTVLPDRGRGWEVHFRQGVGLRDARSELSLPWVR